jgi:hypothetical protein
MLNRFQQLLSHWALTRSDRHATKSIVQARASNAKSNVLRADFFGRRAPLKLLARYVLAGLLARLACSIAGGANRGPSPRFTQQRNV